MTDPSYPGEQWTPANGEEGLDFLNAYCRTCARDRAMREGEDLEECDDEELCGIIAASYRGQAKEWRRLADGTLTCAAYVRQGRTILPSPCPFTIDMFTDLG